MCKTGRKKIGQFVESVHANLLETVFRNIYFFTLMKICFVAVLIKCLIASESL